MLEGRQSTVRKKMAAVHFTTIPCEPKTAISTHTKSHILAKFTPVLTKLCIQGLKFSELFCAFLQAVLGFFCAKNYG